MEKTLNSVLASTDGMDVYEYIVNQAETGMTSLDTLASRLMEIDLSGQFLASTARFLAAVDPTGYAPQISMLVKGAIERDKDRRYIGSLLEAIWGADYQDHVDELKASDDNFRRIYKRIYEKTV